MRQNGARRQAQDKPRRDSPEVGDQREATRTDVLAALTMYELVSVLRTLAPVDEEGEEIGRADVAVAVTRK